MRAVSADRDRGGVLQGRPRLRKLAHVAFWTLLFYGMSAGLGKLLEWAAPR